MGTRTSDKTTLGLPRRNRTDLIDLSHDVDDHKSSNNILDIFDPLSNSNEPKPGQVCEFERSRPSNRSIPSIDLKPNVRRLRASSAYPTLNLKRRDPMRGTNKEVSIYITSDGSTISKESEATHNSISSGRTGSLCNDTEASKDIRRLSLRSNSTRELHLSEKESNKTEDLDGNRLDGRTIRGCVEGQKNDVDGSRIKLIRKHQRSSQELILLTEKLKSFRAKFKHHDRKTNSGLVMSPTLYSSKVRDMSVKIVITSPLASTPINFTCNVSTTIEHLISHAVCTMFESLQEGDSMDNYMLKVTGKDEFFESRLCLADYALVSHCLKFDLDVKLSLIRADAAKRLFQRSSKDDFHFKSLLCPDDLLSRNSMLKYSDLNCEKLNITIDTFEKEALRLYSDVTNKSTCLQTQSLLQVTKAICSLMMNCETGQLSESSNNLAELCKSCKDEGNRLGDEDRYKMIEVIQHAIKRLLENMRRLLRLVSDSLPVDYEIYEHGEGPMSSKRSFVKTSIDLVKDRMMINIQLVAQLKPDWLTRYQEYHIVVELMHGDTYVSSLVTTSHVRVDTSFFPRLLFEEELAFSIQYSNLPRESRLVLTLVGTEIPVVNPNQLTVPSGDEVYPLRKSGSSTSIGSTAPMYASSPKSSTSSSANKLPTEPINRDLAKSVIYVFDQELNLRQGDILLPMHSLSSGFNEDIYMETLAERNDPVLVIELKRFPPEKKIYFPQDPDEIKSQRQPNNRDKPAESLDYEHLDPAIKYILEPIIHGKQTYEDLMDDEKALLWENRMYLTSMPLALPKVLQSAPSWSLVNLKHIYELIDMWSPMEAVDSMQLLLPSFPDYYVRKNAIDWISKQNDDEICDYLPQLLQSFRYEKNIDCPLFWLLLERALKNARIANLLNWQLKLNSGDKLFHERSDTLRNCLLWTCGAAFFKSVDKQNELLSKLTRVSNNIKKVSDSKRLSLLRQQLENVQDYLIEEKPTLPWVPSLEVCDLEIQSCSYFPSKTLPLKLAFRSCEESCNGLPKFHTYDAIFKMGDDLRQDMLAIQMIRIMEKLWLREGLDLRMVTFDCIATGDCQGMVEMVPNAETLRKIQQKCSVLAGAFNTRAIDEYIRLHNTSELEYRAALDRFLHSCAGYSVATYILGICDRHNDNIMVTTSGHLFHIDFGKFLGDAQMMGSIKRDRTPFVLTSDMAYVINGSERQSKKFQTFIELCAMAFNIIRSHRNLFLNLFSLMSSAKIHGLNSDSVKYIDKMLMPNLTETEAMAKFTQLIHECLNSRSAQVNFFIHNLAQLRFTGNSSKQSMLSFVPKTFSIQTDGEIESLELIHLYKKYEPEKQYYYVVRVRRKDQPDFTDITRTFREFSELQMQLNVMFPSGHFYDINKSTGSFLSDYVGYRNNTREVAERRSHELIIFLKKLLQLPPVISQCDLVYTFFHPILRDQATNSIDISASSESSTFGSQEYSEAQRNALYLGSNGQVKLKLSYKNSSLIILIMHAKNLACPEGSNGPNCYAKTYLLPDPNKQTKKKTSVVRQNCHPSFMELIVYKIPSDTLKRLTLQVSIWHSELVQQKAFMGSALIPLDKIDLSKEIVGWYPLKNY